MDGRHDSTLSRYERDYYAWTIDQARLLRSLARQRADIPLDLENLAEEIDDLGRNELHAVESLSERAMEHLLKLQYSSRSGPHAHWKREITAFRIELQRKLTPSLRNKLIAGFAERYDNARRLAVAALEDEEPAIAAALPTSCPYAIEQVIDPKRNWFPDRS